MDQELKALLKAGLPRLLLEGAKIPAKTFALYCARSGAVGAAIDASLGTYKGVQAYQEGQINKTDLAKHIVSESACGFLTSGAGTAGTLATYLVTGTLGPVGMAVGMGSSVVMRHVYRKAVGNTIPEEEEEV